MIVKTKNEAVYTFDYSNYSERQEFDNKFGFHESSLEDFPIENGVRTFEHEGEVVIVGDRITDVIAEFKRESAVD